MRDVCGISLQYGVSAMSIDFYQSRTYSLPTSATLWSQRVDTGGRLWVRYLLLQSHPNERPHPVAPTGLERGTT